MIIPSNIVDFLIDDNHANMYRCIHETKTREHSMITGYSVKEQIVTLLKNNEFVKKINELTNENIMKLAMHLDEHVFILICNYLFEDKCKSIVSSNIVSKYSNLLYKSNIFCIILFKASCDQNFYIYKQYDFLKSDEYIKTIISKLKTIYKLLLTEKTIISLFSRNIFNENEDIIHKIDSIYRNNRNELTISRLKTLIDNLCHIYKKNIRYYTEQRLLDPVMFYTNLDMFSIQFDRCDNNKRQNISTIQSNLSDLHI